MTRALAALLLCAAAPAYCTVPCEVDTQCDNQPWIPATWRCRGTTTRACGP